MKKILYKIALVVLGTASITSCVKQGCTDAKAVNFSEEARDDDGSCFYRGDIVFWTLPGTSMMLNDMGHDTLRFELEGNMVDSIQTLLFFSPTGECGTPGAITVTQDSLPNTQRWFKYRVLGEDFVTLYEDFILLDANECLNVRLD